jgi:hypothetical protein
MQEDQVHSAKDYCRAVADAFDNFTFAALQTDTAEEALQDIQAQAGNPRDRSAANGQGKI